MSVGTRLDNLMERIARLKDVKCSVERIFFLKQGEQLPDDAPPEDECLIYELPESFK